MSVKIEDKGHYELFETTNGNHILVLNGERWFAWVEGQQGEILSIPTRTTQRTIQSKKGSSTSLTSRTIRSSRTIPTSFFRRRIASRRQYSRTACLQSRINRRSSSCATDETVAQDELTGYLE